MRGRWLLWGLGALLCGCRPAAPEEGLRLTPLPQLTRSGSAVRISGVGAVVLTCDTPAGPVIRTVTGGGEVPVPPDTLRCAATRPGQPGAEVSVRWPLPVPPGDEAGDAGPEVDGVDGTRVDGAGLEVGAPAGRRGTLRVAPAVVRLGERDTWTVTAELRGAGGALVPDGTPVTLRGDGPGPEELTATRLTVNGVARWILTPTTAGPVRLRATAAGWQATVTARADRGLLGGQPQALLTGRTLSLGPLRWQDGALPDDGTPVRLRALNRAGRVLWTADVTVAAGQVQVDVPRVPGAVTVQVELAGSELRVPWP